jgi:hypothetical protein
VGGGIERQVARGFPVRGPAPLADAGARGDPLVGGVDELFQIGVGDDLFRQVAAGAGDA